MFIDLARRGLLIAYDKMVLVFSYEDDEYKIYNEITYVR